MPIQVIGAFLFGVFVGCKKSKIFNAPFYTYPNTYPFYKNDNNKAKEHTTND